MKNKFLKGLALTLAATLAVTAAPVNVQAAGKVKATKVTVKAAKSSINVGASTTVKITLNKKNTKNVTVTVKSTAAGKLNKSKVTIKKGKKTASVKLTGKKAGKATVTASFKNAKGKTVKGTAKVTVKAKTVAVTGVALSNNAPKVGDTETATLTPSNATNVASYKWEALDTAASESGAVLGASNSIMVSNNEVGKFIRVTVTDKDGKTFTATSTSAVTENNTASVTVSDLMGLQSDGTGLVNDTLHLSYGAGLGVPQLITWYYNDTVVQSERADGGQGMTGMLDLTTGGQVKKAGKYYAVITNSEGKTYTSNTLTLVDTQLRIEMLGATFTDDYKTAANIDYVADNTKGVVTVKMKKAYSGTFYVYEDSVQSYTTTNAADSKVITVGTGGVITGLGKEVKTVEELTEKNAIKEGGIYYYAPNGETTMMWKVSTGKFLTRGKSYKVAFNQLALDTDDITGTAKKDIVCTTASEMAYLTAPTAVELTTVTQGAPAKANILDADKKVVEFIGDPDATNGTALTSAGFDSFKVYGNSAAKKTDNDSTTLGESVKAGVITTAKLGAGAYYWAELKTTAGVYGEKSVTISTDGFKAKNVAIASKVEIKENTETAAQADIKLEGVVAPSKVYVVAAGDKATKGDFDKDVAGTYRGVAEVKAGDGTATVSGVFNKKDIGDKFTAILIPDDETTYAKFESESFTLKHVATSIEYQDTPNGGNAAVCAGDAATGSANNIKIQAKDNIIVKDQFENTIDATKKANFDTVTKGKATVATIDAGGTIAESADATFDVDNTTGWLTVDVNSSKGTNLGDGYKVTLLGSTFEVKAMMETQTSHADYDVKLGSTKLVTAVATGVEKMNVSTFDGFKSALASSSTGDVVLAGDITINEAYTIPAKTVDLGGHKLTADAAVTSSGTFKGTTGSTIVVNAGKAWTVTTGTYTAVPKVVVNDSAALAAFVNKAPVIELGSDIATPAVTITASKIQVPTGKKLTLNGAVVLDAAGAIADTSIEGAGNVDMKANLTVTKGTYAITGTTTAFDGVKFTTDPDADNAAITGAVFKLDTAATTGVTFTDGVGTSVVKYQPTGTAITAVTAANVGTTASYNTREGAVTIANASSGTRATIAIAASAAKSAS